LNFVLNVCDEAFGLVSIFKYFIPLKHRNWYVYNVSLNIEKVFYNWDIRYSVWEYWDNFNLILAWMKNNFRYQTAESHHHTFPISTLCLCTLLLLIFTDIQQVCSMSFFYHLHKKVKKLKIYSWNNKFGLFIYVFKHLCS